MSQEHFSRVAQELSIASHQVKAAAELLDDGSTVPFISRYRKEATGGLDEVKIRDIRDRLTQLRELDSRRETVLNTIDEQGNLTPELKKKIDAAETVTELEDLYLPYKPKRRTRATVARERGLKPLAQLLYAQKDDTDPEAEAGAYVDKEKDVPTVADALAGARDIVAEWVNEDKDARAKLRKLYKNEATFKSQVIPGKEEEGAKFRDYFDWEEPVSDAPSHRVLAMRRGEKEGFLSLRVQPEEQKAINLLESMFVKADNASAAQVREAVEDAFRRLLSLSMETEIRLMTKKRADAEAIQVFADNLRQLLLAPPLGQKNVLAIDPGFRTGCKVVCLDRQGKLLHNDTIYPHTGRTEEAGHKVMDMCQQFQVEAIAIGNGTASRETERFVRALGLPSSVAVVMVDESGASIYSASEIARDEFPDQDVTVRGSVSIGRRLMDPLAELVKIDPKSIGVGQYQHDVNQRELKQSLDDTVMSCVNAVGVEVNTASRELLTYVSGLGPSLASNIVTYRDANGPFGERADLLDVPRLGPKSFEQSAGFLRITNGRNPLDASAVHPESYPIVQQMASDLGCTVADLMSDATLQARIELERYRTDEVGMPTLTDIMGELARPGRDPREEFAAFRFEESVQKITDLEPGMELPGIVTNITNFGAFIDLGVHQDGLLHISEIADHFVKDANDELKVRQQVTVTVLKVDLQRNRIALSMRSDAAERAGREDTRRGRGPRSNDSRNRAKGSGGKKQRKARGESKKGGFGQSLGDLLKDSKRDQ